MAPLPTSPPYLLGGSPIDSEAARKQENQILLMTMSFQRDTGTPHPTPEFQGEPFSFNV